MKSAVVLFTKYSLLKSRTGKISLIRNAVSSTDQSEEFHNEKRKFLEFVISSEKDPEIRSIAKKSLSESVKTSSAVKKAGSLELNRTKPDVIFSTGHLKGYSPHLDRELKQSFMDRTKEEFFNQTGFINYLRRDFRELIRGILADQPVCGFICSRFSLIRDVYSLKKSLDLQLIAGLLPADTVFPLENQLPAKISGEIFYTLVICDNKDVYVFFRKNIEKTDCHYLKIPVSSITDCHYEEKRFFLSFGKKNLVFPDIDRQTADNFEISLKLARMLKIDGIGAVEKEKRKLSLLLRGKIISQEEYRSRLSKLMSLKETALSSENISGILEKVAHSGGSEEEVKVLSRECRKKVFLLFSDIIGFTEKTERLGTVAIMGILSVYEKAAQKSACDCSGRIVKKMGDGILFAFDEALSAFNCAEKLICMIREVSHSLQEEMRFEIRAVLNSGVVFLKDGDVFGDAVNMLSRIEKSAGAFEIVATQMFLSEISHKEGFMDLGMQELKGFKEPVQVFRKAVRARPAEQNPAL